MVAIGASLKRWVHLDERSKAGVVVDAEKQMVGAGFAGDQPAVVGEQLGFGAGGDVEDVESVTVAKGKVNGSAGGDECGRVIADAGVVGDVVRAGEFGGV